ncbi:T9SS type A sorting domain-containing protein [Salinibacter grassmerensis]|uniref:T9SS type A sorting domain-containing protein n=1 Tax=Salinibacter grassmerensis TaxID=3040353 RepID=UPI0021E927D4|nr:T9SS type A sorting domain-containing protein [Salinibacter grassmerensis]
MLRKQASATIQVNYSRNFPSEARSAFERAVGIWERHISSSVPIVIEANWESLGERVLGSAGPLLASVDADNDGVIDTFRGLPLHDAITGQNQFENQVDIDIVAQFNSDRSDWHFGEEPAPAETIDFTSTVLHEIGHGLNYTSVLNYDTGSGGYGFDIDGNGQIDETERVPGPFARRIIERQDNGDLLSLVNESEFPNPSTKLGDALVDSSLFFTGSRSEEAAGQGSGPPRPKIYAPTEYNQGSSIAHLDEGTYPFESTNALMTPFAAQAETNRVPGPIVCGQLLDMGWTAGPGCAFDEVSIRSVNADAETSQSNQGSANLEWTLSGAATVEEFVIERIYFGEKKEEKMVEADRPGDYSISFNELDVGRHTFRVNYVTADGNRVQSGGTPSIEVAANVSDVSVYPNPFDERLNVSFTLPETQDVSVEVFDVLGRRVATFRRSGVSANDPRPVQIRASDLGSRSSGVYFVQVDGETFEKTVKAVRVR